MLTECLNHCCQREKKRNCCSKVNSEAREGCARDSSREAKQAEKDRFANLSKDEKTAERRAKRAANAATKAALVASSSHYAISPADAINDDDNDDDELDLFRENEIFNLE